MALSTSGARVIDPILTKVAQGYENSSFVGGLLFPRVSVPARGGKIIQFGKEQFLTYDTQRAPGSITKRIDMGFGSSNYSIVDHSLDAIVPREILEEASTVPVNLASASVRTVQEAINLRLEIAQATLATTAANYPASNKLTTLATTTLWSDLTASDPIGNIEDAKDAIRSSSGKMPNLMIIAPKVLKALRQHSQIIDRMKYTGRDVPTPEILAALFGVDRVVVGGAIQSTDAGVFSDVWGKHVVLGYTDTASLQEMGRPSFGYTYSLNGYPLVERSRFDDNIKSWIYGVSDAVQPVIASATSGFLITNAVA